jgi:hypothetical protein
VLFKGACGRVEAGHSQAFAVVDARPVQLGVLGVACKEEVLQVQSFLLVQRLGGVVATGSGNTGSVLRDLNGH